jgi:hypothetical protein
VRALSGCQSLQSIFIPYSVVTICNRSFQFCSSLSLLVFKFGSQLNRIEAKSFYGCLSLKSIFLPASVEMIDGWAVANSGISEIRIEPGYRHFRVRGDFLLDFDGLTVVRYFGYERNVRLPRDIEIVGSGCFSHCKWISSLTFESESKLRRIEGGAVCRCSSLQSIVLPWCIEDLRRDWAFGSSLCKVVFESGLSLRRMIESDEVDLSADFDLELLECDCALNFPGYCSDHVSGHNGSVVLAKKSSVT